MSPANSEVEALRKFQLGDAEEVATPGTLNLPTSPARPRRLAVGQAVMAGREDLSYQLQSLPRAPDGLVVSE